MSLIHRAYARHLSGYSDEEIATELGMHKDQVAICIFIVSVEFGDVSYCGE